MDFNYQLTERQIKDIYRDEFDEGFGDAFNLDACSPSSDLEVSRDAYIEGYGIGVEAWNQIEYPGYGKK